MDHATLLKAAIFPVTAIALVLASCSDEWNRHYDDRKDSGSQSLWKAITADASLSNFASVAKAVGYDRVLDGSQAFCVFAPVNSDFSEEEAQALIAQYNKEKSAGTRDNENKTIKAFLQNHISMYRHSVAETTNDSLLMMNGKYQVLTSTSFAGKELLSSNQLCENGVLYAVKGRASYFPNIFEYLDEDAQLDSIARFINSFNEYEFDASRSVPGDIVGGMTQYLDSVVDLHNTLLDNDLAPINSEDSSYWMVVPTNEVWSQLVPQYEKYFQYDASAGNKRDSLQRVNARMALISGTIFNRTTNTDAIIQDSAISTSAVPYRLRKYRYGSSDARYYVYAYPYAGGGVFSGTANIACSNGRVMKAVEWHIAPEQTFLQTVAFEGENQARIDSVNQATTVYPLATYQVSSGNAFYGKISGNGYVEIAPVSRTQTRTYISLPNLLSNAGYDIYLVTAPAIAGDENASDAERQPTKFKVWLRYQREDGTLPTEERNWIGLDGKSNKTAVSWETTKDKIDTFKIANNISIPYTTYGTGQSAKVELVIQSTPTTQQVNRGMFNRILRIDRIVAKPHEEDSKNKPF